MGVAAAVMSLMLALGYQPLPFRDPGRLVAVWERAQSGASVMAISGPDLAEMAGATRGIFTELRVFEAPIKFWLRDHRGAVEVGTCDIQASGLRELGIQPVLGRGVRPDDEPLSGNATAPAWISFRLWQTRYGGSPAAIGATIGLAQSATGLDEVHARIAGVLPPGVSIPLSFMDNHADVWFLLPSQLNDRPRESDLYMGLGRLRPGASAAQAQAALTVVAESQAHRYRFDRRRRPVVRSLEATAQGPARRTMGLLALGVGLVFLVGCANLAILMVAEGNKRRREIAIQAALGAGRWRLWAEVAAEKCWLALLSLGLGAALAATLLRALAQWVPAAGLGPPLLQPPPLNVAVLLGFTVFALAATLVWAALLVAVADGRGPRSQLGGALAAGSGLGYAGLSDTGRGAGRWRLVLLAAQAGLGVFLLAAAALAVRTYAKRSAADLGPAPRQTALLSVSPRDNVILTDAGAAAFNQQVLSRLGRLPGTRAIALADQFPPPGFPMSFVRQGDDADAAREATSPVSVSPDYFHTLGIPILFGRRFDDADRSGGEPVAIINLEMAERSWTKPQQAVGSQIAFGTAFKKPCLIVGVAANFTGYWYQKVVPEVYLAQAQSPSEGGEVILRSAGAVGAIPALARQTLAGMAIPATVEDDSTLETHWQAMLTRPWARMAGMLLLALLGLGLSVQGVYAVAAATVAARGHELAVRSALGAAAGRLAWNVTRELVLAVVVGAGLGAAASLDLQPLLGHWLGPLAGRQAEPIAAAVALLALAAAAGCYLPARAAARTNPSEALRQG